MKYASKSLAETFSEEEVNQLIYALTQRSIHLDEKITNYKNSPLVSERTSPFIKGHRENLETCDNLLANLRMVRNS